MLRLSAELLFVFHIFYCYFFVTYGRALPGPLDASNFLDLGGAQFDYQNGTKFLLFSACRIRNEYQGLINMLRQLREENSVIVTDTWINKEQS